MQSSYQSSQHPWQIGPTASRVLRWIFGFGFFSVHLGIYLIGGLTLLMINLYRSPDDLWVGGPLVRWGVVVLIHLLGAIITWAATTVMDVAKMTRREATSRPVYQPATNITEPAASLANEPMPVPRPRFQPTISTPIETVDADDSRRFGFRGWKADQPTTRPRTSPPGWTVVRSGDPLPQTTTLLTPPAEQPAATAADAAPLAGDIGADAPAPDNRWTWVEAAAEAWLTNRLDKPETSPSDTASDALEGEITPIDEPLITIAPDEQTKPEQS